MHYLLWQIINILENSVKMFMHIQSKNLSLLEVSSTGPDSTLTLNEHKICESEKWNWSRSVMSNSLRPHGL